MSTLPKCFSWSATPLFAMKVAYKEMYVSFFSLHDKICLFDKRSYALLSSGYKQNFITCEALTALTGLKIRPVRAGFIRKYKMFIDKYNFEK